MNVVLSSKVLRCFFVLSAHGMLAANVALAQEVQPPGLPFAQLANPVEPTVSGLPLVFASLLAVQGTAAASAEPQDLRLVSLSTLLSSSPTLPLGGDLPNTTAPSALKMQDMLLSDATMAQVTDQAKPTEPDLPMVTAPAVSEQGIAESAVRLRESRLASLPALLNVSPTLPLGDLLPNTTSRNLSLVDAIELGLERNFSVKAANERQDSFAQTARAAYGALLPKLDLRAANGTGKLESTDPSQELKRQDVSLVLRQVLFDRPSRIEYERQTLLATVSERQKQNAVSNASLDIASAYLQTLQWRLVVDLGLEYEKSLSELSTYMNNRVSAGGASKAESDRVRARVANSRAQLAQASANLRSASRNLLTLIGETPAVLSFGVPMSVAIPVTAGAARNEALLRNSEVLAARGEADAIVLEEKGQKGRYLPVVSLDLSHSESTNAAGTPSYLNDNKVMLVANWSLLNGGTDLAQSRAAAARAREKMFLADDMQRKLEQEIEATYDGLDATEERFKSTREELAANLTVSEAFKAQLTGGNRQLLDVLDAYQRLHQSKMDIVQLAVGEVQSYFKIAHLTGRLANPGVAP